MIWLLISTSYVVKSNKLIHFDKYDSKLDEYKEKYYPLVTHYDVFDIDANELQKRNLKLGYYSKFLPSTNPENVICVLTKLNFVFIHSTE